MNLSEAARVARNTYMRNYLKKWHIQNPEKGALYMAKYWEKKAKELRVMGQIAEKDNK